HCMAHGRPFRLCWVWSITTGMSVEVATNAPLGKPSPHIKDMGQSKQREDTHTPHHIQPPTSAPPFRDGEQ
ncbi:putative cation-transporting ATPase 13A3, partial [Dissostichus eleginoides]